MTPTGSLPKIIGLCGYPCHGKSTAQGFLSVLGVEARDDAEMLRRRVMEEFDLTYEDVTTQEGKLRVVRGINGEMMTVRKLLGDYGQLYGEIPHGPNYWIDQAIDQLRTQGVTHPVSFGSLRRSQASSVKQAGGFVIAIQDPRKPMSEHHFDEYDYDHVDVMIFNSGSVEDLYFMILTSVAGYLKPDFARVMEAAKLI
jgi:hypothetical protein